MADPKSYKTPAAFRQALEQRIVGDARTLGRPMDFVRKRISFERFLARVFKGSEAIWALKGGYRLELSLHRSRTTKDVDLVLADPRLLAGSLKEQADSMLDLLQDVARTDLGDYFSFQVSLRELVHHATIGGARFTVKVLVAGREFDTFRLDVVLAETQKTRFIPLEGQNWLSFAGIDSPTMYVINDEYQFAEKLHAYTYPWETTENSRSKDLLDLRMISDRLNDVAALKDAIEDIFRVRGKQPIPKSINAPPESWRPTFDDQARQYQYPGTMEECHQQLNDYYRGVLTFKPITNRKEKQSMADTKNQLNVEQLLALLGDAFPNLKGKSLTECVAIAVKESQTANTAYSNQWKALLESLLASAIVEKLDSTMGQK